MRIALDATYSLGPNLTGIGVYSQKLIHGLEGSYPEDSFSLCYRLKAYLRAPKPTFKNGHRALLQPPLPVRSDIFHGLNQRVDRRPSRMVVVTFHDLFVMTANYSTAEFRARFTEQARTAAQNSDLIIAVSSFTAEQIQTLLKVEPSRIRVIFHGVDLPVEEPEVVREKTILFVGALQTRKNVVRLIEAFETLPHDWRLVLAGAADGYGGPAILARIEASPARNRIELTGHLSHANLQHLYRRAGIFAFATLDEGFGIPVLEAMAYGLPVITSNRSALPEVAGEAALLVNPYDVEELRSALLTLMDDADFRAKLAREGRERAAQFPWSRAVEATHRVYQELV